MTEVVSVWQIADACGCALLDRNGRCSDLKWMKYCAVKLKEEMVGVEVFGWNVEGWYDMLWWVCSFLVSLNFLKAVRWSGGFCDVRSKSDMAH